MPTWGGILQELADSQKRTGTPQFDQIRRKYLVLLHQHTQRAIILYAAKWTQPDPNIAPQLVSIIDEDVQGLMEVIHGISESKLDLILHSPGGSLDLGKQDKGFAAQWDEIERALRGEANDVIAPSEIEASMRATFALERAVRGER